MNFSLSSFLLSINGNNVFPFLNNQLRRISDRGGFRPKQVILFMVELSLLFLLFFFLLGIFSDFCEQNKATFIQHVHAGHMTGQSVTQNPAESTLLKQTYTEKFFWFLNHWVLSSLKNFLDSHPLLAVMIRAFVAFSSICMVLPPFFKNYFLGKGVLCFNSFLQSWKKVAYISIALLDFLKKKLYFGKSFPKNLDKQNTIYHSAPTEFLEQIPESLRQQAQIIAERNRQTGIMTEPMAAMAQHRGISLFLKWGRIVLEALHLSSFLG